MFAEPFGSEKETLRQNLALTKAID